MRSHRRGFPPNQEDNVLSLSHCPRFGISEVIRRFFELACAACILTLSAHTAKAQPRRPATLTPEQRLAARRERAVASGPKQYSVPADLNLTSAIDKHDFEVRKDHSDGASRRITHQSGMYFSIPEYHDEQHLQVSNTAFGPLAYFYASPFLGSFTRLSQLREQGTYGAFAALIEVEAPATAGALPPPYTRLGLQVGHSCMWLANASAAEGWKAYVTPITAATRECDRPTGIPAPTQLKLENRFTDT